MLFRASNSSSPSPPDRPADWNTPSPRDTSLHSADSVTLTNTAGDGCNVYPIPDFLSLQLGSKCCSYYHPKPITINSRIRPIQKLPLLAPLGRSMSTNVQSPPLDTVNGSQYPRRLAPIRTPGPVFCPWPVLSSEIGPAVRQTHFSAVPCLPCPYSGNLRRHIRADAGWLSHSQPKPSTGVTSQARPDIPWTF